MSTPEFRRIILIGLGGSGQLVLTSLKRLLMDTYDVVPPSIKLLCVDTDAAPITLPSTVSSRTYTLGPEELLYLRVENPAMFIDNNPLVTWFIKPVPAGAISAGAGAVRQVGRLALFSRIHEFRDRIEKMKDALSANTLPHRMENARADLRSKTDFRLSQRDMEIYVCGSLAGGTGSGTFLDVGILLRHEFPNALIHGFFMLDWIFRDKAFAYRTGPNVYAALCELDNLQSLVYGKGNFTPYKVRYGQFLDVEVKDTPYTLCHLIDGRNEVGECVADGGDLATIIAQAIFLSAGSMGHGVASVVDNLKGHIYSHEPKEWGGKFARYSSLGVSCLCYPSREYWRVAFLEQALGLCRAASAEVASALQTGGVRPEEAARIDEDLESLSNALNAGELRQLIDQRASARAFSMAERSELADAAFPSALTDRLKGARLELEAALEAAFDDVGRSKVDSCLEEVKKRLSRQDSDRGLTRAYRQKWVAQAAAGFSSRREEVEREIAEITSEIATIEQGSDQELAVAKGARYSPWLPVGERRSKVERWCNGTATSLLHRVRNRKLAEFEKRLCEELGATLERATPAAAERPHEVIDALGAAEKVLQKGLHDALKTLESMKRQSSTVIVGNGCVWFPSRLLEALAEQGHSVIRRASQGASSTGGASARAEDGVEIGISHDVFKRVRDVRTGDDYLRHHQRGADALPRLFADYCAEQLEPMTGFTVWDAMEAHARAQDLDAGAYIARRFEQLFRLAAPLWRYEKALVHAVRRPYYDKILSLGVGDAERSRERHEELVTGIKAKFDIGVDHCWTTTGDDSRIWLLSYAAALPAYFLTDLPQKKRYYEEAITPTFHTDSYLEMNVPDVFPEGDHDNISLRLLGMAIVPDIDVVLDEKLPRGHRFSCDAPEILKLTGNEPLRWGLFREMLQAVREDDRLREVLIDLLKRRVGSMSLNDGTLLERGDLRDPRALVLRLQACVRQADGLDRLHKRVYDALSEATRNAVAAYSGRDAVPEELQRMLVSDLNDLLQGPCIHDRVLFQAVPLSREVEQALAQHQQRRAEGAPLVALNRLLLRAAFVESGEQRYPEISLIRRSLKSAVEAYLRRVRHKLDNRDFSRVISARLTYREIQALEQFLQPRPRGYGMRVDDYLAGNL